MKNLIKGFLTISLILCYDISTYAQSAQSDSYFNAGMEYYKKGNYDKAIENFLSCWRLDSVELSDNNYRKYISKLWISNCYLKKNDYDKAREYQNGLHLLDSYDRSKTKEADSLFSLALFSKRMDLDERLGNLMDCEKLYSDSIGEYNANIGVIISDEGSIYNAEGDTRNAILCMQKTWKIFSHIYGNQHYTAKIALSTLLKYYQQLNAEYSKRIAENWYIIKNPVTTYLEGTEEYTYGLVHQSDKDTTLVLPAIYYEVEPIYGSFYLKLCSQKSPGLFVGSDKYQLYNLSNSTFTPESASYYNVDLVEKFNENFPLFTSVGGLLDINGNEFKYTKESNITVTKDSIYLTYKNLDKKIPVEDVNKINKITTLFDILDTKWDSIVVIKEICLNYYLTSTDKDNSCKYGITKVDNGQITEILPIAYDEIEFVDDCDSTYMYATNGHELRFVNMQAQTVSQKIDIPDGLMHNDGYIYTYTFICSSGKDVIFKVNEYFVSFNSGIINELPFPISINKEKDGNILVSDNIIEKKYSPSSFVKFIKSYKDSEYTCFNYWSFNHENTDIDCPIGEVKRRWDYPQGESVINRKVRQKLASSFSDINEQTDNLEYIAYYQNNPYILLSTINERCEDIRKEYVNLKISKGTINSISCMDNCTYSKEYEDDNYVTYISDYTKYSGGLHPYETYEYDTYKKSDGEILQFEDIINPQFRNRFLKLLVKYVAKCKQEKNPEEDYSYKDALFSMLWTDKDSAEFYGSDFESEEFYKDFPEPNCIALSSKGVLVVYFPYSIDSYAEGTYEMEIPYEELSDIICIRPLVKDKKYSRLNAKKTSIKKNKANAYYENIRKSLDSNDFVNLQNITNKIEDDLTKNDSTLLDVYLIANEKLIDYYYNEKQYDKMKNCTKNVLVRIKNKLGTDNYLYINALTKYSKEFADLGIYDLALTGCKELEKIETSKLSTESGKSVLSDLNLVESELYATKNDLPNALQKAQLSVDYMEKQYNNTYNSDFGGINRMFSDDKTYELYKYCNLSEIYYKSGDIASSIKYAKTEDVAKHILYDIRSKRDSRFDKIIKWNSSFLPYLAYKSNVDSLRVSAYNALLMMKNISLNSEVGLKQIIENSRDTTITKAYNRLENNKKLIKYHIENPSNGSKEIIDNLEDLDNVLEDDLINRSKAFGDYQKSLKINIKDVIANVKEDEAAIEFANYEINDNTYYIAYILEYGDSIPRVVSLFDKQTYDNIIKDNENSNSKLSSLIWTPILSQLHNSRKIIFSPVGILYSLGIEYLPLGDKCINEVYDLYRVSSTREIALSANSENTPSTKRIVLYGGINYDLNTDKMADDYSTYKIEKRNFAYRSAIASNSTLETQFKNLPGAQKEVNDIYNLLEADSTKCNVKKYDGDLATESSLKSMSSKKINVLHIATHGFYLPKDKAKGYSYDFLKAYNNDYQSPDADLLRSGLIFAGANNAFAHKLNNLDIDDGILTSLEISALDFRNMDLAVLSACQTAQGEITDDGVSGLQRGFKKAGVKTLLMSLWNVSDDATQILMTRFYENLISGKTKYESFQDAQTYLRSYDNGKYKDPKYWKAFIILDAL